MTARHLIVGLDGADLGLIQRFGADSLPTLHRLMERGAYAALKSVQPPATLPNWTTFLTGVDPGQHGVFDFTTRSGYQVKFSAGTVREAPTIAARLDRMGKRCACLFFPATFPPERLENGLFISGWDAPVAFEADRSFVWPPQYHDRLVARFGPTRFDDVDEFDTESPGWHDRLPQALCERVRRRVEVSEHLLDDRDWDLFAVYFGESDTAGHHLWALHDETSPRRPHAVTPAQRAGLLNVYRALDDAVARLLKRADATGSDGDQVEVTLVSDHGFGGSSDRVLYLNRVLEQAGFLKFKPRSLGAAAVGALKEAALTRLPLALRDRVFRLAGATLPSLLESRARFGAIDMARTQVFSDELNYFPALHLNLQGREPAGLVAQGDVAEVVARVRQALLDLRDPLDGQPVVNQVWSRDELFDGPYLNRAPDLLLDLNVPGGYSYNLMPSVSAPSGTGAFRRLRPDEYLGRKGRSLQGSHRGRGFYAAAGPSVHAVGAVNAGMADATATVLARMQLPMVPEAAGSPLPVLGESTPAAGAKGTATLPSASVVKGEVADDAKVAARLRRLGYIE